MPPAGHSKDTPNPETAPETEAAAPPTNADSEAPPAKARKPRRTRAAAASATTPAKPDAVLPEEAAPEWSLMELVDRLPQSPGVYLMKDKKGRIVYVGKAANLRQRVRSYFAESSSDTRGFVRLLHRILRDIETVVTSNEKEALLLENNLIKQHKPKFNVKLVDDKNYLVLRLDPKARYPRLEVTRRINDDGARYFGPYHSATSCRQTLKVVNRHFKLRTCTDQVLNSRQRPCLQFQIKRCDAPCVFPISQPKYGEQVRDVSLFLDGKSDELIDRIRERMLSASEATEYEAAAALRDQLHALQQTLEEQRVVSTKFLDQDVFGYYRQGDVLELAVLSVRQGKLLGRRSFRFPDQEFPDQESISAFVGLYYDAGNLVPDEVLLPIAIEDLEAKREWLTERRADKPGHLGHGHVGRIEVLVPQRGARAKLVELANRNAEVSYTTRRNKSRDVSDSLVKLQRRLGLKKVPRRIECFDISHLQGTDTVASRVVFIDGEPAPSEYRTFKVRTVTNDDFASMYEVLSRRFRRALAQNGPGKPADPAKPEAEPALAPPSTMYSPAATAARRAAAFVVARDTSGSSEYGLPRAPGATGPSEPDPVELTEEASVESEGEGGEVSELPVNAWQLPDLLVIDGGKGQLATALAALKDVGINWSAELDVIGLAKERENTEGEEQPDRVFLPRTKDPIRLRPNTAEMFVLSRIRDEAHRVAVGFHKKLRSKRVIRSQLSDIPGVGPKRQKALLRALGSVRKIRESTIEELAAVAGMNQKSAETVHAFFHGGVLPAARPATANAPSITERPVATNPPAKSEGSDLQDAAAAELAELTGASEPEPEAALAAAVAALTPEASTPENE